MKQVRDDIKKEEQPCLVSTWRCEAFGELEVKVNSIQPPVVRYESLKGPVWENLEKTLNSQAQNLSILVCVLSTPLFHKRISMNTSSLTYYRPQYVWDSLRTA
jgi:hypothetical protein